MLRCDSHAFTQGLVLPDSGIYIFPDKQLGDVHPGRIQSAFFFMEENCTPASTGSL